MKIPPLRYAFTLAATLISSTTIAQTIYFGGYGGSFQKIFEERVIPVFEQKTGAKVIYVPGQSADTLAKLTAQKGNQDISIALIDDGFMFTAIQRGLCASLKDEGHIRDTYPIAKVFGNNAIGVSLYAIGLGYNTEVFARQGWEPPTSFLDLEDPKYRGRVSMSPISGYGMMALVAVARANGGDENNLDPGFRSMADKVAPNVFAWEASQANLAQLLQTGEVALVFWGDTRIQNLIDQGAPVAFVYPKEGALSGMTAACVVEGAPHQELAQLFVQELLSPETQLALAQTGFGPVNSKVTLPPEIAQKVVYGSEKVSSLVPVNWTPLNRDRAELIRRWNREVER